MSNGRGSAMSRMAESMLRALGGCEVQLLLPLGIPANSTAQQLGLASTEVEAVTCSPVVVRGLSSKDTESARHELLFPASMIQLLAETRGIAQPELLFKTARAVQCGHNRLRIESVATDQFAGEPYLYRVTATE